MTTSTTEFFHSGDICIYKVQTFEDNDQVVIYLNFTTVVGADAYFMYSEVGGDGEYTTDEIEMITGYNTTY